MVFSPETSITFCDRVLTLDCANLFDVAAAQERIDAPVEVGNEVDLCSERSDARGVVDHRAGHVADLRGNDRTAAVFLHCEHREGGVCRHLLVAVAQTVALSLHFTAQL